MNYNDISEIRESANAYVIDIGNAVSHNMADPVAISASAKRLHDAITTFDFKELPRVLDGISARSLLVRPGLPDIVNMAKKLQSFCGAYRTKIKAYDPDVLQVALFCNEFVPLMEGAIEKLKERVENEPTEEDIQSAEIIHDYLSGLYPDKTFSEVLHGCVFLAADDRTLQRRGKYLAEVFNNVSHDGLPVSDEIMSYASRQLEKRAALGSIKDLVMKDEAKKKAASTATPASTPEPQPSPSVQTAAKDNAALPDFSHMNSYTPTIPFNLSALYSFLICEGVIHDIDEELFTNCITHAHMNEVFRRGKKAKLKCVISHLKSKYNPEWFDVVCQNLGTTKQKMGKFYLGNSNKRKEFEQKLTL